MITEFRRKNAIWKIYHRLAPSPLEDKQRLVTAHYRALSRGYQVLRHRRVSRGRRKSFYMGGEPAHNFVRIWVDYRGSFPPDAKKLKPNGWAGRALAPYIRIAAGIGKSTSTKRLLISAGSRHARATAEFRYEAWLEQTSQCHTGSRTGLNPCRLWSLD
jgi:hypothetical protein